MATLPVKKWGNCPDPSRRMISGSWDTRRAAPAAINPPRSWPKEEKQRFLALPYTMQAYLYQREGERDRAVRKAQKEAGDARKKLAEIEGKKDAERTAA